MKPDNTPDYGADLVISPSAQNANLYEVELSDWLDGAKNIGLFKRRIGDEVKKMGLSDWIWGRLDIPLEIAIYELVGTEYMDFQVPYIAKKLYQHDLLLQHALEQVTPIFQSKFNPLLCLYAEAVDGDMLRGHQAVVNHYQNCGYDDVFLIPLNSCLDGGRVMVSFCVRHLDAVEFKRRIYKSWDKLLLLAKLIDVVGTHKFPKYFVDSKKEYEQLLNSRPMELMKTMAREDLTLYQGAEKLCISLSTAEKHATKVRLALNCKNTWGAVYRAKVLGYF